MVGCLAVRGTLYCQLLCHMHSLSRPGSRLSSPAEVQLRSLLRDQAALQPLPLLLLQLVEVLAVRAARSARRWSCRAEAAPALGHNLGRLRPETGALELGFLLPPAPLLGLPLQL